MQNKKLYILLYFLFSVFTSDAQSLDRIYTGDKLQELELGTLLTISGQTKKIKLSDYKGKLVILDFWNTHCGPCVKALPKMDSLQRVFGEQIVILPVTYEHKPAIMNFRSRQVSKGIKLNLPSIIGDTVLSKRFPTISVPHEVWIDVNGTVIAQTLDWDVNAKNIERALAGKRNMFNERRDYSEFKHKKQLFLNQNSFPDSTVLYQRLLTGSVADGLTGGAGNAKVAGGKAFRFYVWNQPVNLILMEAFNLQSPIQIDWSGVKDRSLYELPKSISYDTDHESYMKWVSQRFYCYELVLPIPDSLLRSTDQKIRTALRPVFRNYLQSDIANNFGLKLEYTYKDTLVFVLEGKLNSSQKKGSNHSANSIASWIRREFESTNGKGVFVLNEALEPNKGQRIHISESAFKDYGRLTEELNSIGLTLSKKIRKIPILTVSQTH